MKLHFLLSEGRKVALFLFVGGLSTVCNYAVFWVCLRLFRIYYLYANLTGYAAGLVFGFFLNSRFTFQAGSSVSFRLALSYVLVYAASLALSNLTLWLLVDRARLVPELANIYAIVQSTVTNYLGCRLLVFRGAQAHGR